MHDGNLFIPQPRTLELILLLPLSLPLDSVRTCTLMLGTTPPFAIAMHTSLRGVPCKTISELDKPQNAGGSMKTNGDDSPAYPALPSQ